MVNMNYAQLIREKRKGLGITQAEFAKLVGLSQPIIARYENGATTPHPNTWRDICRALGIDYAEIKKPLPTEETANEDAETKLLLAELAREMLIVKHELRKVSDELAQLKAEKTNSELEHSF